MTDDDELTPAQQRVRTLLEPLREERAPQELVARVGTTTRWQRPVRRALLAVGHAAAAFGVGIGALVRAGRKP